MQSLSHIDRDKPLDRGLNAAIMHMASRLFPTGFEVSSDAPNTWRKLKAMSDRVDASDGRERFTVWNGGSDGTIYADAEVNYCFRAWHDWCHLKADADFTVQGEVVTTELMCFHLEQVYGRGPTTVRWQNILRAEVIGQAIYYARRQMFVHDQYGFIIAILRRQNKFATYPAAASLAIAIDRTVDAGEW